ncbi:hypothetical protein UA08_07913 [Talaromyces atroroseus]|uniref:Checkpoint protein hus1 n=1 Tax=Talaromyces atroroseus TaxID=1441469 RepID=A0A225AA12_TALAT|nr:hypothetical protein UA08_07913 [Talaromyces atroroseus]OKL56940.1 hypothetical protein UA08_07913 [Talaromyces atroroseus]
MGSSLDMTLIIPALISLAIYLLFSYLIIPFFRRYRQRYSQYLPLSRISAHTLPLRERIGDALMHFFLPSTWRLRRHQVVVGTEGDESPDGNSRHRRDNSDSISIFDEEGENMADMNYMSEARREALEARRSTSDAQVRLGRDLEEGFMDDSDEEEEEEAVVDHGGRGR